MCDVITYPCFDLNDSLTKLVVRLEHEWAHCFKWILLLTLNPMLHFLISVSNRGPCSLWIDTSPNSKLHGANMGPIWGRQDPGGLHVGSMNDAIWFSWDSSFSARQGLDPEKLSHTLWSNFLSKPLPLTIIIPGRQCYCLPPPEYGRCNLKRSRLMCLEPIFVVFFVHRNLT